MLYRLMLVDISQYDFVLGQAVFSSTPVFSTIHVLANNRALRLTRHGHGECRNLVIRLVFDQAPYAGDGNRERHQNPAIGSTPALIDHMHQVFVQGASLQLHFRAGLIMLHH
jgi:hypothetical protein